MTAAASSTPIYAPGLEGIVAGETAISSLEDGLRYRGYAVGDLAQKCSFDEVAYLLLYGDLPTARQLSEFQQRVAAARKLPEPLLPLLKALPPTAHGMDVIRTAVSVLGCFDPETADTSRDANIRKGERLLGQIPVAIAAQFRYRKGLTPVAPRSDLGHAGNFLYMLRGTEAAPDETRAFDLSLTLYAEHEFNASTFTARVVTSTEADLHSAIVGGIGALKGPLHGGANEKIMDLLRAAGGPDKADAWIRGALARKEKVMGFGHRVYKAGDVRAGILKVYARKAAERAGTVKWEDTAEVIEQVMAKEKNLHPNLDWPAGRLYFALGLETMLYTPIFVMSRVAGWTAHVIEQAEHNRIIRPRSRYTGPEKRAVSPIAERT